MTATARKARAIKPAPAATAAKQQPDFKLVDVGKILFDADNPRLLGDDLTATGRAQEALQKRLMEEPHLAFLLIDSFVENGFISYEPLVVRKGQTGYIVIEGNRRLAAVKHIVANRSEYRETVVARLETIPVLIFPQGDHRGQKEASTYLGVRHLVGYREWPPEAKARYLDNHVKSKYDLSRLEREIAMKRADVRRYLIPYRVKKEAARIIEEFRSKEDQAFWMLGEALQRTGIREYIRLVVDPDNLTITRLDKARFQNLMEFLYGSTVETRQGRSKTISSARITETRQISRLAKVLANSRASKRLEDGRTLEEAELYLSRRDDTLDGLISDLEITLQRVIALTPTSKHLRRIDRLLNSFKKATQQD